MEASRAVPNSAAPTPFRLIPAANINTNTADVACLYFTDVTGLFGKVFFATKHSGYSKPVAHQKKQAAQVEALSGLVGEVLRGRRNC